MGTSSRIWLASGAGAFALALVMMNVSAPDLSADAARALETLTHASFDSNHHVEVESGENSAAGGETFYSDVSHSGNVWLLRQRSARSSWRRFGMLVQNRHVYFASLDHTPKLLGAECAECHPNGPRAIQGELRAGLEMDRNTINAVVENVSVLRPYYPPSEPQRKTAALALAPCVACHDGRHRSQLTAFNHRAIAYKLANERMPPHSAFTAEERMQIIDWLEHH